MKKLKTFLAVSTLSLLLFACGADNKELLVGTWNEIETGESVSHYNADGTFEFNYDDGKTDKGTWRVEGSTLYTTYEGDEEELSEEISQLDDENLVVIVGNMFQTKYKRAK